MKHLLGLANQASRLPAVIGGTVADCTPSSCKLKLTMGVHRSRRVLFSITLLRILT